VFAIFPSFGTAPKQNDQDADPVGGHCNLAGELELNSRWHRQYLAENPSLAASTPRTTSALAYLQASNEPEGHLPAQATRETATDPAIIGFWRF
jgi:hypothetical protein